MMSPMMQVVREGERVWFKASMHEVAMHKPFAKRAYQDRREQAAADGNK
jgi:hypothetical protein